MLGGNRLSFSSICRSVLLGDNISGHLYYLSAYFWGIAIILLVPSRYRKYVLSILSLCLLINLFLGRYSFVFEIMGNQEPFGGDVPLGYKSNAITLAIPCMAIGVFARQLSDRLTLKLSVYITLLVLLFSYIEFSYIRWGLHHDSLSGFLITTYVLAMFLVITFAKLPFYYTLYNLVNVGKFNSTDIYLWHPLVGSIVLMMLPSEFDCIVALVIYMLCIIVSKFKINIKSIIIKSYENRNNNLS